MTRLLVALFLCSTVSAQAPYDIILTGAESSMEPAIHGFDVAIRNGHIARIAPAGVLRNVSARERIDLSGLMVAPVLIRRAVRKNSEKGHLASNPDQVGWPHSASSGITARYWPGSPRPLPVEHTMILPWPKRIARKTTTPRSIRAGLLARRVLPTGWKNDYSILRNPINACLSSGDNFSPNSWPFTARIFTP